MNDLLDCKLGLFGGNKTISLLDFNSMSGLCLFR